MRGNKQISLIDYVFPKILSKLSIRRESDENVDDESFGLPVPIRRR